MELVSRYCKYHPTNHAVVFCKGCNAYICKECIIQIGDRKRCRTCYNRSIINKYKEKISTQKIICSYCHESIESDSKYCKKCGKIIGPKIQRRENKEHQHPINRSKIKPRRVSVKDLIKPSLISGMISFVIFIFLIKLISKSMNYSKVLLIIFSIISLLCAAGILYILIKKSTISLFKKFLSALAIVFIVFSGSCFIEHNRIIELENFYNSGLSNFNTNQWAHAKKDFLYVAKKAKGFKETDSLLHSTIKIINKIKVDSLIQLSHSSLAIQKYYDALRFADNANKLIKNLPSVEDIYYRASVGLLAQAQTKYWQKSYTDSRNHAEKSFEYLNKIKSNNYKNINTNISKAEKILSNSKARLEEIEKLKNQKFKRQLEAQRAREAQNDLANLQEGQEMAVAFNLIATQGKRGKIGWILQADLKKVLERSGHHGYVIRGGTKVELYDKIVYQVDCFKNDRNYYAYVNSNLSYSRWSVSGVYYRGR